MRNCARLWACAELCGNRLLCGICAEGRLGFFPSSDAPTGLLGALVGHPGGCRRVSCHWRHEFNLEATGGSLPRRLQLRRFLSMTAKAGIIVGSLETGLPELGRQPLESNLLLRGRSERRRVKLGSSGLAATSDRSICRFAEIERFWGCKTFCEAGHRGGVTTRRGCASAVSEAVGVKFRQDEVSPKIF